MELVSGAVAFVAKTDDGIQRKEGKSPYIFHSAEATDLPPSDT